MANKASAKSTLRQRAEQELKNGKKLSPASAGIAELFHELEVRQVELEMQNRELQKKSEELYHTKKQIQKSLKRYEELYDYAPMAYLTINPFTNRIIRANVSATDLLKTSKAGLCRNGFAKFIEPESADIFHTCAKKALKKPYTETFELKMRRNDGTVFWALLEVRGAYRSNEIRIAVADITERKKIEQIKDDFIGMVSHELRTPLTIVMGAVKVAQSKGVTVEELKELLQEAEHGSETLSHLLDNLIELSRYQSDRLKLNTAKMDIESAIRDIVNSATDHLNDRTLLLDIRPKLPEAAVDKRRLELVIHNLLDNAAKYSTVDTEIHVFARYENGYVIIGVSDHGKGISQEEQEKLFSPFERLREGPTTKPGLGLGLIVCKRLVEAHGGTIWVESKPGAGTTFWFTLPVQQQAEVA